VTRKSDAFVQDCVLGFGFFGGLFTWLGIDPEEEMMKAFLRVAIPNNESLISFVIVLIGLALAATGVLGTLHMAGRWGLLVVGMAWISGFMITVNSLSLGGAILLIVVLILGPIVCDNYRGS
jgi:hypothetical protein